MPILTVPGNGGGSGATGPTGPTGPAGPTGPTGSGVSWTPIGVTAGQSPFTASGYQAVMADAAGGTINVVLPSVAGGQPVQVTKIDASANIVTLTPASGNINNAASVSMGDQGDSADAMPDGTNWWLY